MPNLELQRSLGVALEIVEAAGAIALEYFRHPLDVTDKADCSFEQSGGDSGEQADFDPVTVADREIERFIRRKLAEHFPQDGIIGEEEAPKAAAGPRHWVIDPIDGTRAFLSGMPAWGILLGLMEDDRCLGGMMHQPYLEETFYATTDKAWLRHRGETRPLHASGTRDLASAILYSTHPSLFRSPARLEAFDRVASACRMMRYGGDCYSYCLLALGTIDLVIEDSLKPFDIIPLIPLIQGAGGIVTDEDGRAPLDGGFVVAAATPELHREALALMGPALELGPESMKGETL